MQSPLIFALAILLGLSQTQTAHGEPTLYGQGAQVVVLDDTGLTKQQQKGLQSFARERAYFGAFAASPTTGRWDYEGAFNNLATVQKFVLGKCNILGKTSDCKIVAISLPKSIPSTTQNAAGLSSSQSEYYVDTYLKSSRRYPRDYAAFATNGFFAVARWGRSHKERAVSDALADCRRYGARFKAKDTAAVYKLRVSLGLLECKIEDVRRHKDRS